MMEHYLNDVVVKELKHNLTPTEYCYNTGHPHVSTEVAEVSRHPPMVQFVTENHYQKNNISMTAFSLLSGDLVVCRQ